MTGRHSRKKFGRAKLSPLTVIGELLFLSGLVVVGYLVWQPWYTGTVVVAEQAELSTAVSAELQAQAPVQPADVPWDGVTPIAAKVPLNNDFGVMYIPAFGATFANVISEGTSRNEVLNLSEKGIGRYDKTQMPGEPGNFAVAAHRSGPRTTPFKEVMNLRLGDSIYVQTAEGWYTYSFRSIEYVLPEESDVLMPFPRLEGVPGVDQLLTLTTCHPKDFGAEERVIAYAVLDQFQPTSEGPPETLMAVNPEVKKA